MLGSKVSHTTLLSLCGAGDGAKDSSMLVCRATSLAQLRTDCTEGAERLKACTHGRQRYISSCSSPPLKSPWSPSLTVTRRRSWTLSYIWFCILWGILHNPPLHGLTLHGKYWSSRRPIPKHPRMFLPHTNSSPLSAKEGRWIGWISLNYGFSEKGTLKNVPSPVQAPGQGF